MPQTETDERIPIWLTREQIAWLLAKTIKHLGVYEERLRYLESIGQPPSSRLRLARYDVQQATAIAEQVRAQPEAGEQG